MRRKEEKIPKGRNEHKNPSHLKFLWTFVSNDLDPYHFWRHGASSFSAHEKSFPSRCLGGIFLSFHSKNALSIRQKERAGGWEWERRALGWCKCRWKFCEKCFVTQLLGRLKDNGKVFKIKTLCRIVCKLLIDLIALKRVKSCNCSCKCIIKFEYELHRWSFRFAQHFIRIVASDKFNKHLEIPQGANR